APSAEPPVAFAIASSVAGSPTGRSSSVPPSRTRKMSVASTWRPAIVAWPSTRYTPGSRPPSSYTAVPSSPTLIFASPTRAALDRERDRAARQRLVIAAEQAHGDAHRRPGDVLDRVAVDVQVPQIRILDQPAHRVLPQLRVVAAVVARPRRGDETPAPQRV